MSARGTAAITSNKLKNELTIDNGQLTTKFKSDGFDALALSIINCPLSIALYRKQAIDAEDQDADQPADEGTVDAYVLKVLADIEFDLPHHMAIVPCAHLFGDEPADFLAIAFDERGCEAFDSLVDPLLHPAIGLQPCADVEHCRGDLRLDV